MIERIDRILAEAIDHIDLMMDRLWLLKLNLYFFLANKLYDKIIEMTQEIEGAEI